MTATRSGSSSVGGMTAPTYLTLSGVAERAGVQYRTMRNYHQTAERNRRLAKKHKDPSFIRPGDLPEPDDKFGRSPVWLPSTIDEWIANRPGRGVGGGRPQGYSPIKVDLTEPEDYEQEDEQE